MNRISGFSILVSLLLIHIPVFLLSQTSTAKWSIYAGAAAQKYSPAGEQVFVGETPWYPAAKIGVSKYLSPGFDFRTEAFYSPSIVDPLASERVVADYFAFQYVLAIKLNNGLFLREDTRIAPYALIGAGGSYQSNRPDAYSPFGLGLRIKTSEKGELKMDATRQFSWNRSAQPISLSLSYCLNLTSKQNPADQEPTTPIDDLLASQKPADSDADGVPDAVDECPYEAGFIQNNGCPVEELAQLPEIIEEEVVAGEEIEDLVMEFDQPMQAEPEEEEEEIDLLDLDLDLPDLADDLSLEEELTLPNEEEDFDFFSDPLPETNEEAIAEADIEEPVIESPIRPMPEEPEAVIPCAAYPLPLFAFKAGESELSDENKRQLDQLASSMATCPDLILVLQGTANDKGNEDDNLVLSIRRAYNVKYYLVYEKGISQRRIFSKGSGSSKTNLERRAVIFAWSS
ncbi:MAG: OmpA family protein [Bacteroidia bacterium]|nr:OmpA family protein [Bacteroidia bacterium]